MILSTIRIRPAMLVSILPALPCSLWGQGQAAVEVSPATSAISTPVEIEIRAELVRAALEADVILLGEVHTDSIGHRFKHRFFRDILRQTQGTALSLEFLQRTEQSRVDDYLAGRLSRSKFVQSLASKESGGPGGFLRWYQPLVDLAREAKVPVIAANPPRELARLARVEGYQALKRLPESDQANFDLPVTRPDRAEYQRFAKQISQHSSAHGHKGADRKTVNSFLRSQELWNSTMAASILRGLDKPGVNRMVHVVGGFHIDNYGGIVRELRARRPALRILTIQIEPDPTRITAGRADFLVLSAPGSR
jgi:uncharacterized iron-regulated protein